jgi:hypothetical protein
MKVKNKEEVFNMIHKEMRFMMGSSKMTKSQVRVKYSEEMGKFCKETLETM